MTARLTLHAAALLFVITAALTAQTIPPTVKAAEGSIDPEKIRAHVQFLADDLFEGRGPGLRGGELAAEDFVAKFTQERTGMRLIGTVEKVSGSDGKKHGNELCFRNDIALCYPSHSSLADHAHGFDAFESSPGTLKRTVTFGQPRPFLYGSVVLFNDIVEILALTQPDSARK
jgi:hypothetical protein